MKKFLNRLGLFFIPTVLIIVAVLWLDLFKIFGFQDYYASQKVSLNRGMVTSSTYTHLRGQEKYDSFIFGSSRSQAYKCEYWGNHLDADAKPFHYDAAGEGIWDISKKVAYIDRLGDTIKNALVILDRELLTIDYPRTGHLYIATPSVSEASVITYYSTFLKAMFTPKFLMAYFDYSIFNQHRDYMGNMIKRNKYNYEVNNKTCDIWYGWDQEIATDSLGYFKNRIKQGVFYERPKKSRLKCPITEAEASQLKTISQIFKKHQTKYKIIISPIYDQIPLEAEQLALLEQLFGRENIYNFSGKNEFTDTIHNYYETSHYRPLLANEIMDNIYKTNPYTTN